MSQRVLKYEEMCVLSLYRASAEIYKKTDEKMKAVVGLGIRESWIIFAINQQHFSQKELGAALGINQNVMVNLLDGLEDSGYLIRKTNEDNRRSHVVELTKKGRVAATTMVAKSSSIISEIFYPLSMQDIHTLRDLCGKLLNGL